MSLMVTRLFKSSVLFQLSFGSLWFLRIVLFVRVVKFMNIKFSMVFSYYLFNNNRIYSASFVSSPYLGCEFPCGVTPMATHVKYSRL